MTLSDASTKALVAELVRRGVLPSDEFGNDDDDMDAESDDESDYPEGHEDRFLDGAWEDRFEIAEPFDGCE